LSSIRRPIFVLFRQRPTLVSDKKIDSVPAFISDNDATDRFCRRNVFVGDWIRASAHSDSKPRRLATLGHRVGRLVSFGSIGAGDVLRTFRFPSV
jgi:hypothetical protein